LGRELVAEQPGDVQGALRVSAPVLVAPSVALTDTGRGRVEAGPENVEYDQIIGDCALHSTHSDGLTHKTNLVIQNCLPQICIDTYLLRLVAKKLCTYYCCRALLRLIDSDQQIQFRLPCL